MKIQDFINKKNKYKVDFTYQRPNGVWSVQDNQCFIDSILKNSPIPLIILNKVEENGEDVFYIVDGQQRLNCIRDFYDNKIKLNEKFSGSKLSGKTFNGENHIPEEMQDFFLDYNLPVRIMENYTDEQVRIIFSRLQRGKPLNLGERLNALPGSIVNTMREISEHHFIKNVLNINHNRYNAYPLVARMLFFEVYNCKDCSPEALYNFFEEKRDLTKNDNVAKLVIENLNYLDKCFSEGKHPYLSRDAWIIAIYCMISDLKKMYSMTDQYENVKKFILDFYAKVYNEDFRNSNSLYSKYYDNVRGGWSERLLKLRKEYLMTEFIRHYDIKELDSKRQISDEEKLFIYNKHPFCTRCGKKFNAYNEAEYHHIQRYADGGKSVTDNIGIYCTECHDIIHGKKIDPFSDLNDIDKPENI